MCSSECYTYSSKCWYSYDVHYNVHFLWRDVRMTFERIRECKCGAVVWHVCLDHSRDRSRWVMRSKAMLGSVLIWSRSRWVMRSKAMLGSVLIWSRSRWVMRSKAVLGSVLIWSRSRWVMRSEAMLGSVLLRIRPSDTPFAGAYGCTFQPENFTGWGSEGVMS